MLLWHERLLAVFLEDADVVPVLPNDMPAISDVRGERLGGENHPDRKGDGYQQRFHGEALQHAQSKPENR